MKKGYLVVAAFILALGIAAALYFNDFEYALIPEKEDVKTYQANHQEGLDVWGKFISVKQEGLKTLATDSESEKQLSDGSIKVDENLLKLGREVFYKETFGNEVFLTDVMGIIDGPLTIGNIAKAIAALRGKGTTNLRVELAEDIKIGDRLYQKGEKIDTGIDVPKGAYAPLGMPVSWKNGKVRVGISCAACHATVDPETKTVVEGAPNNDLNAGLIMALATNSTAYFTHTNVKGLQKYIRDLDRKITDSTGKQTSLPDPVALEEDVDKVLASWPRGNFDSTIDLEANPAQIPDSFTLGDHPYGWSGFAAAGPFHGLTTFSNNVHAQNADALSQSEISKPLFGIDKEVYLGVILQNAANPKFRYKPNLDVKPSEFFNSVDPTPGVVGINKLVAPPQFPKVSLVAPDGLIVSEKGFKFNEQNNAVAAWQNTINPPRRNHQADADTIQRGREVFARAGCIRCHAGNELTNHKVISAKVIGTEPSRAKALKKTEKVFGESVLYSPDTPVPIPKDAKVLKVPTEHLDPEQVKLAFAHGDSPGGYKVPSLIGLSWTAPYLHDGGVAVGPNNELGVAGTLLKGIVPDPRNSLRALIDKELRNKVIKANASSKPLQSVHVSGIGHTHWIDETTGFTKEEQDAVIEYLLSLTSP
jgi:hypothetical protein